MSTMPAHKLECEWCRSLLTLGPAGLSCRRLRWAGGVGTGVFRCSVGVWDVADGPSPGGTYFGVRP